MMLDNPQPALKLGLDSPLRIPSHVQYTTQNGVAVLAEMRSGRYLGLDEVGTCIWTLLTEGATGERIVARLAEIYPVDEERLRTDVVNFVQSCCDHGLLEPAAA